MSNVTRIYASRQPRRPHFIPEWAEKRGLTQADLARELDVDKSLVSRWYAGSSPSEKSQAALAALFHCEPGAIFNHPDEDWITRFFRSRTMAEIERAKQALEIMFPKAS
jgi:transcriptional regulator with XRE-family HTH domain